MIHYLSQIKFESFLLSVIFYLTILSPHSAMAVDTPTSPSNPSFASIGSTIADDYKTFYSSDRLTRLGIAFGVGAVAANTNIDMGIRNWYQDKVRDTQTNSWSSTEDNNRAFKAKFFGEGKYMVPIALLAASVNLMDADTAVGSWGAYTSRAFIVGLPPMWAMQFATGAARPSHEVPEGSAWQPFNNKGYAHGVSGHSFVGAVPFITIAYMNQDNPYIKYPAYLASAAAGWSRINDDAHFPSQVVLGWYMAFEAVDAVFENNRKVTDIKVAPMLNIDGTGVQISKRW